MAIKPILFNTDMVRAILDGRKACTRRAVKHNVKAMLNSQYHMEHPEVEDAWLIKKLCRPPYEPGDILYVRETFMQAAAHTFWYKADDNSWIPEGLHWHPSIHMPKEAARIWLKVTDVQVERLQDITSEQIYREGAEVEEPFVLNGEEKRYAFSVLWNSTIKKSDLDRYGWDANPYVFVIEFSKIDKPEETEHERAGSD